MNINETVVAALDMGVSRCYTCSAEAIGSVNDRTGFCVEHKEQTLAGQRTLLDSVGAEAVPLDVKVTEPQGPFTAQYARLAARGETLAALIKESTEELDRIKAQLRELGAGNYKHGGRVVATVGPPPLKFDEDVARSVLTLEQQAQVTKTSIDSAKVKALFGEDVYNTCRKDQGGKASVSFPGAK